MDIYSIGLKVDSRQVKTAQKDLGGMGRQAKQTGTSVRDFGKNVDKSTRSIGGMGKGLEVAKRALGGFTAALAIRQIQSFTTASIQAADAIDNASRTAGIGAERLQELRFAFSQLVGTTDTEVDSSIRRFNRRLGLATQGAGAARDTFGELSVKITDAGGKIRQTDAVLNETLKSLANIQSDSLRAAKASEVFGEDAGPKLAAALSDGIDAMDRAAGQAVVMSDEIAAQGSRINDEIQAIATNIRSGLQNVLLESIVENEDQLRSLFATTLRGLGTVVQYSDEVAGPLGAGVLGRVLFGTKGAVIGTLIASSVQAINAIIDRANETVGEELARVEGQIESLTAKYEGMDIPPGAANHLKELRAEQERLSDQVQDNVEYQNDYNAAIEQGGDVGQTMAQVFFDAADSIEATGSSIERINGPDALPNVDLTAQSASESINGIADSTKTATERAEELGAEFDSIADQIEGEFSDAFYNIFEDGLGAFDDLADGILDIFRRTLADMAAAAIRQQIVIPITQQVIGGAGDILSGGQSLLSGGGAGDLLGALTQPGAGGNFAGQFATSGVGQSLGLSAPISPGPGAPAGTLMPTGTGQNVISAAGAATSLAGIGGGFLGSQIGGGTQEANIGSTLGTIAGGFAGPVGSFIGGVLGGAFGGLFGDDPHPSSAINRFGGTSSEGFGGLKFRTGIAANDSGLSSEEAAQLTQSLNEPLQRYAESLEKAVFNTVGDSLAERLEAGPDTIDPGFTRAGKIKSFVEDYLGEEGKGFQAGLSAILGNIIDIVGEEVRGPVGESIEKLDTDAEEFGQRFGTITSIFAEGSEKIITELSGFVDQTDSTGGQFVEKLQQFNAGLKQLRRRGEFGLLDQIGGSGDQAQNLNAYLQTVQSVDDVLGRFSTQEEKVEQASQSLVRFSEDIGLTGDEIIDSASTFRSYVDSLDLTTQAGREAAQSALQYSDAFGILNDAFQQRVSEIEDQQQQRVSEIRDQQQQIASRTQSLSTEILQSFGRTAQLVRQQLAGMTSENAALQIALNLRENVADAEQQVASAEQDLASIYRDQANEASNLADQWKGLTDTLRNAADELFGVGISEPGSSRTSFRDTLQRALGGDREAFDALPQLASDLSDAERSQARTLADSRRANAQIAVELDKAANQAEKQFLEQRSELKVAEKQLDKLVEQELTLRQARDKVAEARTTLKAAQDASTQAINSIGELLPDNIVNGLMEPLSPLQQIDASTKAMVDLLGQLQSGFRVGEDGTGVESDAIQQINKTYKDELGRAADATGAAFYEGILKSDGVNEVADQIGSSAEAAITDAYRDALGRDPDPTGREFYLDQIESGKSIDQIERELAASQEAQGFADGGIASGPTSGYRATLHGTEAVIPLNGQRIPLEVNNQEMIQELRDLRQEVSQLRTEQGQSQYQIARNTKRTRDTLEQFDIEGLPPERSAT